jgi:hypothetical protein
VIPEDAAHRAIGLAERGWSVSKIARHLGHDRRTIRVYLRGERAPGQPREHADSFTPFTGYVARRARDDPHLRAAGLHRELVELGYIGSYSAFTREVRSNRIRTDCPDCLPRPARPSIPTLIGPLSGRPGRSLPIRVAPLTGEAIVSYLGRLAAANHVPVNVILAHLPSWFTARTITHDDLSGADRIGPDGIEYLATLTGLTVTGLQRALPAFGLGRRDHPGRPSVRAVNACRRCAARHGQADPVPVHLPSNQRLCGRHRIWLGDTCQIDLRSAPEIIHAHHMAARLAHRHGTLPLLLAEINARQRVSDAGHPDSVRRRIHKITESNPGTTYEPSNLIEAATYPEAIRSIVEGINRRS